MPEVCSRNGMATGAYEFAQGMSPQIPPSIRQIIELCMKGNEGGPLKTENLGRLAIRLLIVFVGFTASVGLWAQSLSSTASLSGTASDPSGARIPGATVVVNNAEKGITRTFKTDSAGQFSFALLPAGTYVLTAEAHGFNKTKQEDIALRAGDSLTENVTLTVAAAGEQVTVTAATPLLQTESANVSTEVSTRQIEELPLNLRNVTGLVLLNSSVNNQTQQQILASGGAEDTADQDESFLSFGGGFFGTTAWLLDGGWNVAMGWGGVVYVPAADDVQEFKAQSNSFSAQYGWSTGNVVSVITKSGTRDFHIVLDEYLRNQALDANTFFNNRAAIPKSPDHRNQFGVAGGGPLYIPGIYKQREKTFFFANYEGLRLNSNGTDNEIMPTSAQESGDFSAQLGAQIGTDALGRPVYQGQIYNPYTTREVTVGGQTMTIRDPYPGNVIPTSGVGAIDPLAKTFASGNYWPGPKNPTSQFNFNVEASQPTASNEYGIRIDHNFSQSTRIYGRWSQKFETKSGTPAYYGTDPAGPEVSNPDNRYNIALGGSHIFSPNFIFNVNATFGRWVEGNVVQNYGFKPSSLGLPGAIDAISPQFPQIAITNYAPLGARAGFGQFHSPNNIGSLTADFNWTRGQHSISFGYMGVINQIFGGRIVPTAFCFGPTMTSGPDPTNPATSGDGFAAFMVGAGSTSCNGFGYGGYTGFNAFNAPSKYFHGEYVQDDWKASRKLTLNLGFRYEVQTPIRARHDEQAYFDFNALNPISVEIGLPVYGAVTYSSPGHRDMYSPNWTDLAPRGGFSYSMTPKLLMRGGIGLYYSTNYLGGSNDPGYSQNTYWPATIDGITPNVPFNQAFATGILPVTGSALAGLTNVGASGGGTSWHRPDPRVDQFMYGFQYGFNSDNMLDVSYIGNRGTNMILGSMNYGELSPQYLSMGSALNTAVANPFANASSLPAGSCLLGTTVPAAQLLLPYPEFCGNGNVGAGQQPIGNSNYNALQANFSHRETWGLTFMASYTYAKFLDDVGGPEEWGSASSGGGTIRNYYNLRGDWAVDSTDIPQGVVLNYVYEIPLGRGKKFGGSMPLVANAVVGGWQFSGISNFKAGFPLSISNGGANNASLWGGNQHATVAAGFDPKGGSCVNGEQIGHDVCWFNGSGFTKTPAYQFGNAPRYFSNLRAPGYNDTDLAIQKWFSPGEGLRIQFQAQMFNFVNHANFTAPDSGIGDTNFGLVGGTMGPRQVQFALRIYR